jgi:tetratricopeptide (TPR) repeat protein
MVFEPAGDLALKGKSAPVPAWRAMRVVAQRGGRGRTEALEAPFVGRDEELRQLKDLFHATSREQRVRTVSVTGIAGIGKSRLAWEFLKYVDGLVEPVWWHAGRSPSYGSGITFWALGEMVRSRVGLVEGDDEPTTRAKVATAMEEFIHDADERRWIEQALLALLGVGGSSAMGSTGGSREELFAAWRTFFERLAEQGTVAMVFEDLQWADTGLLDFLDHLAEWSRGAPIFILTLARPELLERRPDWGAGKRTFAAIGLEPLPDTAMRELLAGLVPGLPEQTVRAIVARADGIPLYAVETVRMLVSEGKLVSEEGGYRPVGDLSTLAVPETLHALIAARLDALEHEDRVLVQDASVLGQSFTVAALAAVAGKEPGDVEPRLKALVRREVLVLDADQRSPERGQFGFVQALLREVAYSTMARKDRKQRHLAAARYFETVGGDELAGALASQYLDAYRNAPDGPEADALAAQARITLSAAAERAVALGSLDQAVVFFDQARELTSDSAEEADLLMKAGDIAIEAGHGELAETNLRRALELLRAGGDTSMLAQANADLGRALIATLRTEAAVAVLEAAAAELIEPNTVPADSGRVALLGQLSRAYFFNEDNRRAVEVADRALDAAEHLDLVAVVADVLITRGSALNQLGRSYEGVAAAKGGIELADERGIPATALRGRINLGAQQSVSDPHAALESAKAALAVANRLGRRNMKRTIVGNVAASATETGDWDWAIRQIDDALEGETDMTGRNYLRWFRWQVLDWQGEADADEYAELVRWAESIDEAAARAALKELGAIRLFAEGRFSEAAAHWLAFASGVALGGPSSTFYAGVANLLAREGSAAAGALQENLATGVRGPLLDADRRLLSAGIDALEGRTQESLGAFRDAIAVYDERHLPWRRAMAGLVMIAVLGGSHPDARAAADETRAILSRLRARPFLEHLDRLMAEQPSRAASRGVPAERAVEVGVGAAEKQRP